tara:strand:+ start:8383 stop:9117 length:735 start_codon:yes stop_codon:yes gene_type:complete
VTQAFDIYAITHTGLVRPNNEDRIVVNDWASSGNDEQFSAYNIPAAEPLFCLVADGMGGHTAGEIASRIAADELSRKLLHVADPDAFPEIIEEVNQEIFSAMEDQTYGMGTTIAGIRAERNSAIVFNVGDSRVYVLNHASIHQVSVDDTLNSGSNGKRKLSNAVTQSLGGGTRRRRVVPHVLTTAIEPGQKFLICSDGLSDFVKDHEIAELLRSNKADAAENLRELALTRGGEDNISIVLILVR